MKEKIIGAGLDLVTPCVRVCYVTTELMRLMT
jgi:hypothetical protein